MSDKVLKSRRALLLGSTATALAGLVLSSVTTTAYAQDQAAGEEEELEQIIVTGSRIKRPDLTAPSPISVVGAEEFELTGTVNVENLLNDLPQVIPGLTGRSNNPGNGTATVDLRGLGASRTLVLVNGRRYIKGGQSGIVDLNTIPSSLIKRTEVVTGGASAVYGSDAVAGVVNFVLKDDFEGFELSGQYDVTDKDDGDTWNIDGLWGGNFADGKGNAVVYASYLKRKPIMQGDRPFSTFALQDGDPALGTKFDKFGLGGSLVPGGSSGIPGTRVFGGPLFDSNGDDVIDDNDSRLGKFVGMGEPSVFRDPEDRFNYAPDNFLQLPQERWMMMGMANYEVNEGLDFYVQTTFVNNRVDQELAPTPAFVGSLEVDVDSPFFSSKAQQALALADSQECAEFDEDTGACTMLAPTAGDGFAVLPFIGRRMVENGPRRAKNERNAYQFVVGARGDLGAVHDGLAGWSYDISYNFNRMKLVERLENDVSETRFRQAIKTEFDDNGNLVCTDPSGGCVPLDIFGPGNISQEAVDFINIGATNITDIQEQVFNASVTGDLFELPGGTAGVAFGFEWRDESSANVVDEFLASGDVLGFNAGESTIGNFDVSEVFGEIYLPILSGVTGAERLEVNGAFRFSDYSLDQVDTVWTYAGGITYAPISDITFRAQFQRAVRAPSIIDLFLGQSQNFPGAQDPCDVDNFDGSAKVRDLCIAQGVPSSQVGVFQQANSQVEALIGGNPDLEEERSDTITFGAVLSPEAIPGLNVTLDYFDIKVKGAIGALSAQNTIDLCFESGDINNEFCQLITRRPDGNIDIVTATNRNIGTLRVRGLDLQADYSIDLADLGLGNAGSLDLFFLGTWFDTNKFQPFPGADFVECAGQFGLTCGGPTPDYAFTSRAVWRYNRLTTMLRYTWINSVSDDRIKNDGVDPATLAVPKIGAEGYVDLTVGYNLTDNFNLRIGVRNVFDNKPPFAGDT
ncbi:MAG: TonB-dependent receptor, partial [Alphaproteobacteria bacterium]